MVVFLEYTRHADQNYQLLSRCGLQKLKKFNLKSVYVFLAKHFQVLCNGNMSADRIDVNSKESWCFLAVFYALTENS